MKPPWEKSRSSTRDLRLENDAVIALVNDIVRPLIEADGGSIEVVEVDGDKVTVRLGKACVGCPGAYYTKEFVIRAALEKAMGKAVALTVLWHTTIQN